ncbi:MAG TPA: hypothetical protein V6C65_15110, partial [Allocoleopsis sp.]
MIIALYAKAIHQASKKILCKDTEIFLENPDFFFIVCISTLSRETDPGRKARTPMPSEQEAHRNWNLLFDSVQFPTWFSLSSSADQSMRAPNPLWIS